MDETTVGSFQYKGYGYLAIAVVIAPIDSSLHDHSRQTTNVHILTFFMLPGAQDAATLYSCGVSES